VKRINREKPKLDRVPGSRFIKKFVAFILVNLLFTLTVSAHGISDADKRGILEGGNFEYLKLGASHMLTGYDHLLFLFGVMFFLTRFGDIVKFITAFTVGHCLTLVFATLLHIQANYYLVDAVIALTVCYKAFDNLDGFKQYIGVESPNLLGAVTLFGLIHGFGLSTRLQQLPLGQEGLVLRILSFNLGVEAGQILALAGMWIVLSSWRKTSSFLKFGKVANATLMFAGLLLLLMQLHGYQHTRFTDDFPLNKDEHFQIHQNMERIRDPGTDAGTNTTQETLPQNQQQ
jgi:hypothetical protein